MLYKYPYTNLYNLNLDWLIQAVKELQEIVEPLENVVTSVNGMTGNVELTREILTQILGGMVSKFNGRDGDVELTAEDVNDTLIDITWTSDPGDVIGDLTQTELDQLYINGKRILIFVNNLGVADQVYFLQYYDNHAMPQEYSPTAALAGVATFNGQTGNVTATGADLATSGTDQTTIAANLANLENTKVPNTRTVNNKPLSTNISINAEDIPSQAITGATDVEMALGNLNNSKVPNSREVNNKSLITSITLNDEDIPSQVVSGQTTVEGVLTDLDTRVSNQSQQIDDLGPYNGLDSDSTIAALSAAQGKALNTLLTPISATCTRIMPGETVQAIKVTKIGRLCILEGRIYCNQDIQGNFIITNIPESYRPSSDVNFEKDYYYGGKLDKGSIRIGTDGNVETIMGSGIFNASQYYTLNAVWIAAS